MNGDDLYLLAESVGAVLAAHSAMLSTAESCTGGWISQCVTDVPGSSAWFDRGFVTYSNEAKVELLGVPPAVLQEWGAVSDATVLAMAGGALRYSRAHCAVAVSGIAGPAGGSVDKPVGTVWLAWQRREAPAHAQRYLFVGDRRAVRQQTVRVALEGIVALYAN